jgi:quercetin dioxygenase-like cupin family protein
VPANQLPRRWSFLGVLVDELTEPGAPVTVAVGVAPEGASPPAHIHADLDDSFYLLDGRMVIRCGDEVWEAGPGSWVQFPAGVLVRGLAAARQTGSPQTAAWRRVGCCV